MIKSVHPFGIFLKASGLLHEAETDHMEIYGFFVHDSGTRVTVIARHSASPSGECTGVVRKGKRKPQPPGLRV